MIKSYHEHISGPIKSNYIGSTSSNAFHAWIITLKHLNTAFNTPRPWWVCINLSPTQLVSSHTVDVRNLANQLIWLSHSLQGFIHPRWLFGMSSINSIVDIIPKMVQLLNDAMSQELDPAANDLDWRMWYRYVTDRFAMVCGHLYHVCWCSIWGWPRFLSPANLISDPSCRNSWG